MPLHVLSQLPYTGRKCHLLIKGLFFHVKVVWTEQNKGMGY